MFRSRELARDPSLMSSRRKAYESFMSGLFRRFKGSAGQIAQEARNALTNGGTFSDQLVRVVDQQVTQPGTQAAMNQAQMAYKAGTIRGADLVKAAGIKITGSLGPLPPNPAVLAAIQESNIAAWEGITDDMAKRIKASIISSSLKGESIYYTARHIREQVEISRKYSITMARTETMRAYNAAAEEQFRKYNVPMVEWLTAYDERTCEKCIPLNGKQYPIDDHPDCPLHARCRCILLPVVPEVPEEK